MCIGYTMVHLVKIHINISHLIPENTSHVFRDFKLIKQMIKQTIFSLIFTISLLPVISQNTFLKVYRTEYQETAYEAIQTSDGSYIIVGRRASDPNYTDAAGLAIHVDCNGDLIDELVLENENRTYFSIVDRMPTKEDEFLLIGSKDSITSDGMNSSLNICVVDVDLNIESQCFFHSLANHRIGPFKHAFNTDSTLCLLIQDWDLINSPLVSHIMVSEVKLPCDSIRTYWPTPGAPNHIQIPQDIQFLPLNEELRVIYNGGLFEKVIPVKIIHLDKNFNQDTIKDAPIRSRVSACTTAFTDSTYLLTTTATHPELYNNSNAIQIHELDRNSDTIIGTWFSNHPDTVLYAGFGTNTTVNGSSVFTAGIYNINPSQYPWQNTPTWIQVTKLDLNLNVEEQYFYGGDALYYTTCITSTDDNGVLITGNTWGFNIPGIQQHDIFALKLNSDGLIVNVPENAPWQVTEAILYPNPASEIVTIEFSQLYQSASFQLMDMGGKLVLEKQLIANYQSIDISAIPAGTYVYRIFNKDGLDEGGKVVVHQ